MKRLLMLLVVGVAAGCGTAGDAGSDCKKNADCDLGLACAADVALNASGYCTGAGTTRCTKQCVTDAECTKTAPVCRIWCNGSKSCAVL